MADSTVERVVMLEACALSDKGCVRANNEDYSRIEPEMGLYVLADGMGGAKAGERASRLAVDTVSESIRSAAARDSRALLIAVEEANRRVLETAAGDPSLEGMGTTLVAALEVEGELLIASVGDSRAYLLDREGFRAITQDQSWVNEVGRPLGLNEETLRTHPMRHVLTMAIGAGVALEIKYYQDIRPQPGDMVLMCSDGLHGVVDEPRIAEILRDGAADQPLIEKCRALIEAAREAGGPDNITAVLLRAA
ncbi:MAG TPA: PP2C family serine/threonine-protein phosphatase [Bryobacteraceae bacterium]|nr:PP2C family serine/threonine-protein phosphatase [Bryobacteraceae bacterium]